jgi:hypothetical protein
MAVYNAERHLDEAIASIRAQTRSALELIVVDDGSTDGTAAILERHRRADDRVKVVRFPHRGLTVSLNAGCALAGGELIARMDGDDVALPDRFERQVAFLERHPTVAAVGGAYIRISPSGEEVGRTVLPTSPAAIAETLPRANCMLHPAVTMRAAALRAAGGYRAAFLHAQDYDLWLRMGDRFELANLGEAVLKYRLHAGQVSAQHVAQQAVSHLAAQACAQARRLTGSDPVVFDEPVSRALLTGLGVSDAAVDTAITAAFSRAARLLRQAGAEAEAEELLRTGIRTTRRDAALRRALGAIYRARARRAFARREPGRAVRAVLQALRADPLWLASAAPRAFRAVRSGGLTPGRAR